MRLLVVLALTAVGLFVGSPAWADAFPDLPGMDTAEKTTAGASAQVAKPRTDKAEAKTQEAPDAETVIRETVDPSQTRSVRTMPGGGSLPVINGSEVGLASSRGEADPMPRGLAALAALGTLISVGAFLFLRNRLPDG